MGLNLNKSLLLHTQVWGKGGFPDLRVAKPWSGYLWNCLPGKGGLLSKKEIKFSGKVLVPSRKALAGQRRAGEPGREMLSLCL